MPKKVFISVPPFHQNTPLVTLPFFHQNTIHFLYRAVDCLSGPSIMPLLSLASVNRNLFLPPFLSSFYTKES